MSLVNNFVDPHCEFHCDNGECIPGYWVCDYQDDCGDNTDENEELCGGKTVTKNDTLSHTPYEYTNQTTWSMTKHKC